METKIVQKCMRGPRKSKRIKEVGFETVDPVRN
jgi:hypothetical protein